MIWPSRLVLKWLVAQTKIRACLWAFRILRKNWDRGKVLQDVCEWVEKGFAGSTGFVLFTSHVNPPARSYKTRNMKTLLLVGLIQNRALWNAQELAGRPAGDPKGLFCILTLTVFVLTCCFEKTRISKCSVLLFWRQHFFCPKLKSPGSLFIFLSWLVTLLYCLLLLAGPCKVSWGGALSWTWCSEDWDDLDWNAGGGSYSMLLQSWHELTFLCSTVWLPNKNKLFARVKQKLNRRSGPDGRTALGPRYIELLDFQELGIVGLTRNFRRLKILCVYICICRNIYLFIYFFKYRW